MIDKESADWKDVKIIRKLIREGKTRSEINFECSALSHVKYPFTRSEAGHILRQKYRHWLKKMAFSVFQKKAKA